MVPVQNSASPTLLIGKPARRLNRGPQCSSRRASDSAAPGGKLRIVPRQQFLQAAGDGIDRRPKAGREHSNGFGRHFSIFPCGMLHHEALRGTGPKAFMQEYRT
jgi:hypothetical protein